MNIQEQLKNGSNVMFVLSGGDLQEFALALISETQKLKESEMKDEVYLSADEAAKELQVTKPTLWRWDKTATFNQLRLVVNVCIGCLILTHFVKVGGAHDGKREPKLYTTCTTA